MEVPCNDHIVIGANSYYSFKEKKVVYMYEMQIKDLTKMNIQCCDEFTVEGDALCIPYELWFNVDEYFGNQRARIQMTGSISIPITTRQEK